MDTASRLTEVSVPVAPMTPSAFAPYGEAFGRMEALPARVMAATGFEHEGRITLGTIWNPAGGHVFSRLERHFGVTQAFVQLSGAPAVVCVAPPSDRDDPEALPDPRDVRGFLIDPGQGWLFHRGTWHGLDRCVLAAPGATFMIVNVAPNPTQVVDFAARESSMHEDLDTAPPRALPWPDVAGCRFRVAAWG